MNFIKTPTPDYRRHGNSPRPHPTGLLAWLANLLQTPTPVYKTVATQGKRTDDSDR